MDAVGMLESKISLWFGIATSEQAIYCLLRFLFAKIRAWQYAAAPPFSQKVTFASAIRLQAPSLTPLAHYQPFASVPAAHIFIWFGITTSEWTLLHSDFCIKETTQLF